MSYDEKKQYIQDKVLQGCSVMEKLIKLNENKLQVDTQNFKDRLDSSRKIKMDKFLLVIDTYNFDQQITNIPNQTECIVYGKNSLQIDGAEYI